MRGPSRRQFGAMLLAGVGIPASGAGYCSQEGCTSLRNSSAPETGPEIRWRQERSTEIGGLIQKSDIAVGAERLYVSIKPGIKYFNKQSGNGTETHVRSPNISAPFGYLRMVDGKIFAAASSRSQSQRGWVILDPNNDDEYRLGVWGTSWNPTFTVGFDTSHLVVGGENQMEAYDFENGERLWTSEVSVRTGVAVGADRVYTTLNVEEEDLYGIGTFDVETGETREQDSYLTPAEEPLSPPVFANDQLYVADRQTVYAISPSGTGLWQFDLGNANLDEEQPIQFRAGSLIAGGARALGVLDPKTGTKQWSRRFSQWITAWGATESSVFTLHNATGLRDTLTGTKTIVSAYDLESGRGLGWRALESDIRHVESGPNALYVITRDGEILALRA